jgi:hypothetical protein
VKQRSRGPTEFDVFICCAESPAAEMVSTISGYLQRHGFRVHVPDRPPDASSAVRPLTLVESIPDFVVLLTPATLAAASDPGSAIHAEIARALATGRNVVLVSPVAGLAPPPGSLPAVLSPVAHRQVLGYHPDRLAESLSILQHSLSSDTVVDDRHLMRRTKRLFIFAALFVLVGASLQVVPALLRAWNRPKPPPPVAPFTLYWAGFGHRVENAKPVDFPLEDGVALLGGDQVSVAFSPSANGFAYVIGKDARGRVAVLFPVDTLKGASRVRAGQVYRAPVDSDWLAIDPQVGLDTIYVFGSYDPLQNLEELVEEPETPFNIAARGALVEQTVNGLIDGRHYQFGRRPWIRSMQYVEQGLSPAPGPATFTVSSPAGAPMVRKAVIQPGLVSALAEIKVTFVAPQTPAAGEARKK